MAIHEVSENKRSAKALGRVTWVQVIGALADDETRSCALGHFRDSGFSPDSFATRIEARRSILEGLVRAEDWTEVRYPRRDRSELRAVRRRLELELDP